ncbi:hypothetical protein [Spirosoma pollinicola]|uniref:Outer membrane protein beta-barrel domain-containing protein n=1 Tax=Spirosoma pollinicola TaxID=2057025 RepID=A0A2K8Z2P7_9BACT|nr:hypothetical protein [Spirosoma pollinicola]AUD04121.1 hypothetical protein CWM47_21175 [Spirosoma pollinicola]
MKLLIFLILIASLCYTSAANAQNKYWSLGPALSLDQYKVNLPSGTDGAVIKNPVALSYGIDLSYLCKQLLFDVKVLTSNREYRYSQTYPITSSPDISTYATIKGQYLIIPVTVSYRLISGNRFTMFAGVGAIDEWVPNGFKSYKANKDGMILSNPGLKADAEKTFRVGGNAQAVFRYNLSTKILLSLEPSYHLFSRIGVPAGYTNQHAFSGLLSMGYKL